MKTIGSNRVSKFFGYCALLLGAFAGVSQANNTWYVATNAVHTFNGTSWTTAFTNIQQALDAAQPGHTIYLAGHTFVLTNQLEWFAGKDNIKLLGGYEGTGTPGNYDPDLWPTVITSAPDVSKRLLRIQSVSSVTLAHITFQDAFNPSDWEDNFGGAIRCDDVTNLLVRNCRFLRNGARGTSSGSNNGRGGGMALFNTSGIISNCLFSANYTQNSGTPGGRGGGVYLEGGGLLFRDCVFEGNRANPGAHWATGGAADIQSGAHEFHNVLFYKNRARQAARNRMTATGGGMRILSGATVTLRNTTFYGHVNEAIRNDSVHTVIENSIFFKNTPDFGGAHDPFLAHTLTGDGLQAGINGNITGDPLFAEERGYLLPDSPCINAGTGTVVEAGLSGYTTRTDGTPATGTVDMGFHHRAGAPPFDVFYVSETGSDGDDGVGWGTALRSITRALELGGNRVRVHLGAGEYTATTESFPLARRNEQVLQILGTNAALTRLDANGGNNALFDALDAWGPNRIEGVTLIGGSGEHGRGIQVVRGTLYLEGCVVTNNHLIGGHTQGAALRAEQAKVNAIHCVFADNSATAGWDRTGRGGGIYLAEVTGGFRSCDIRNNILINGQGQTVYGGGLYTIRSRVDLHECRIVGNEVRHRPRSGRTPSCWGGGIYAEGWPGDGEKGWLSLRNVLIADNRLLQHADGEPTPPEILYGGGIWADDNAAMLIENSTIVTNIGGRGLRGADGAQEVINTILWDNVPSDFTNLTASAFSHSRADELSPGVDGNITEDPLFIDPSNGDYGLQTRHGQFDEDGKLRYFAATSPCIDAGINRDWMAEATDVRGFPRLSRGIPRPGTPPRVDMGAIEVRIPPAGTVIFMR